MKRRFKAYKTKKYSTGPENGMTVTDDSGDSGRDSPSMIDLQPDSQKSMFESLIELDASIEKKKKEINRIETELKGMNEDSIEELI